MKIDQKLLLISAVVTVFTIIFLPLFLWGEPKHGELILMPQFFGWGPNFFFNFFSQAPLEFSWLVEYVGTGEAILYLILVVFFGIFLFSWILQLIGIISKKGAKIIGTFGSIIVLIAGILFLLFEIHIPISEIVDLNQMGQFLFRHQIIPYVYPPIPFPIRILKISLGIYTLLGSGIVGFIAFERFIAFRKIYT
ncbi:MAG: hypothetical protein ACFFA8_00045 [Promethearchaeota archaeon]